MKNLFPILLIVVVLSSGCDPDDNVEYIGWDCTTTGCVEVSVNPQYLTLEECSNSNCCEGVFSNEGWPYVDEEWLGMPSSFYGSTRTNNAVVENQNGGYIFLYPQGTWQTDNNGAITAQYDFGSTSNIGTLAHSNDGTQIRRLTDGNSPGLQKLTMSGDVLWTKYYSQFLNSGYGSTISDIQRSKLGGYIIMGNAERYSTNGIEDWPIGATGSTGFVFKINEWGNVVWSYFDPEWEPTSSFGLNYTDMYYPKPPVENDDGRVRVHCTSFDGATLTYYYKIITLYNGEIETKATNPLGNMYWNSTPTKFKYVSDNKVGVIKPVYLDYEYYEMEFVSNYPSVTTTFDLTLLLEDYYQSIDGLVPNFSVDDFSYLNGELMLLLSVQTAVDSEELHFLMLDNSYNVITHNIYGQDVCVGTVGGSIRLIDNIDSKIMISMATILEPAPDLERSINLFVLNEQGQQIN